MRILKIVTAVVLLVCAVADGIPTNTQKLQGTNLNLTETIQTILNATLYQQKNVTRNFSALLDGSIFGCPQAKKTKKYLILGQKVDWLNALTLCKQKKMDLATIRSQEENDLFEQTVRKSIVPLKLSPELPILGVWIGGTNLHSTDLHYWITDGQLFLYTYSNWYKPSNEPSHPNKEHCVAVDFRDGVWGGGDYRPGTLGWNDWECQTVLPFVGCEYFL